MDPHICFIIHSMLQQYKKLLPSERDAFSLKSDVKINIC